MSRLKEKDMMDMAMAELSSHFPGILQPLVRERDAYLAYALLHVPGEVVVAVIGKGYTLQSDFCF
jgi:pheromone shutdown protein TraB